MKGQLSKIKYMQGAGHRDAEDFRLFRAGTRVVAGHRVALVVRRIGEQLHPGVALGSVEGGVLPGPDHGDGPPEGVVAGRRPASVRMTDAALATVAARIGRVGIVAPGRHQVGAAGVAGRGHQPAAEGEGLDRKSVV